MRSICQTLVLFVAFAFFSRTSYAQVLKNDSTFTRDKQRELLAYDPDYLQHKDAWLVRIKAIGIQLYRKEASNEHIECEHQLFSELIWLYTSTADAKRINAQLDELETMLKAPTPDSVTSKRDKPQDCGKDWFFKITDNYDELRTKMDHAYLLDTINSPEKLTAYFKPLLVSDITHTSIDNERELNESLSNLMRLILRVQPEGYHYHPELKATLMKMILNDMRNPVTGFWGERYVRNGKVVFIDDMSMTFHVLSFLNDDIPDLDKYLPNGKVPGLDKVLKTVLAIKNYEALAGWLYKGKYWNHISVDAIQILRTCWPIANPEQKKEITVELDKMLHQCITISLQPDGSFKPIEADGSIEECTYFGETLLSRLGYFDPSKRFWTTEKFPEAEAVRLNMIAFIKKHIATGATGGEYYRSALKELEGKD